MTAKITTDINIRNEAERANALIDKFISDPKDRVELKNTLTPAAITFLLRWEGARDLDMEERVIGIVMKKMRDVHEKDNDTLCKNVTDIVCSKLNEFVDNIYNRLEALDNGQKEIMTALNLMNQRLDKMEKRVYTIDAKRFRSIEKRILGIEKMIDQHLKDNSK
jgi:chaperonin cofactor prefoldin